MPSYCSRRKLAPSAIKETLAEVKQRLTREMSERTETRVRYWRRREEWCQHLPGRVITIGWDLPILALESWEGRGRCPDRERPTVPVIQHSSCVETPD